MLELSTSEREAFARRVADQVYDGEELIYLSYEPGDMTHYDLVLADMSTANRIATPSPSRAGTAETFPDLYEQLVEDGTFAGHLMPRGRWLLADGAVGFRAMTIDLTREHYTDPTYVAEKWRQTTLGSAIVIAELLNMITGSPLVHDLRASYPQVFGPVNGGPGA